MANANIDNPDFVFLFGTVGYKQDQLLKAVRAATGNAPLSGCSGEGVIIPGSVHETNFGVVVCVLKSDEIQLRNAVAVGMSQDATGTGKSVGGGLDLASVKDPLALITFADRLTLNSDAILRGLMTGRDSVNEIPMLGGTASDNWTFSSP